MRLAAEIEKMKHEFENKLELEKEKSKREKIRMEAERDNKIAAERKRLQSEYKMKMDLESEKQKAKQEADNLRIEKELKAKNSQDSNQVLGQLLSGALTGITSAIAAIALSSDESPFSQPRSFPYEQQSSAKTNSAAPNYRRWSIFFYAGVF